MVFKFQQGGTAAQAGQQDIQQQVVALVQAAMQGDEKARKQVQDIVKAAQNGDQQAIQLANMIQEVVQAMQNQARRQKIGGKMDYIHKLRTGVNPDEEVVYAREGGKVVKKTVKKDCSGTKFLKGSKVPSDSRGCAIAPKTYFECSGGKAKKVGIKKHYFGGSL